MIGKITRQELHPSLLTEINNIKLMAQESIVKISFEEPENVKNGVLWFDLNTYQLMIRYESEWIKICNGHSGGEPEEPGIKDVIILETENKEHIISGEVDDIEVPFDLNDKNSIVKIYANGLLLLKDIDYIVNENRIARADKKKWNQGTNDKTKFLFVKLADNENNSVKFNHDYALLESTSDRIEIQSKINNNTIVTKNKVLLDKDSYKIEDRFLINNSGEWEVKDKPILFEFLTFTVDRELFGDKDDFVPVINQYSIKASDKLDKITLPFQYNKNNYYEIVVNGITIYSNDYTIEDNELIKKEGKWDKETDFYITEISNIKIN